MSRLSLAALVLALTSTLAPTAAAGEITPQRALDKLKALEGRWVGTMGSGDESQPYTVEWSVTAGGNVVMERQFVGSSHEMVTVYHLDGDDLVLTHYCAVGNQPSMKATRLDDHAFLFDFSGGTNMKRRDPHMHEAHIQFLDEHHLRAEWTFYDDGKPQHDAVIDVHRQQG